MLVWRYEWRVGFDSSSAVIVVLDIHFPGGMRLLKSLDEVACDVLVAPDGNKGITEEVESSSCVITFDDSIGEGHT